jgi:hypothetical protein
MSRLTPRVFWALVALAVAAITFTPKHHEEVPSPSRATAPTQSMAPMPASSGMCDQPPFGARKYKDLAEIFGAENIHDLMRNTCRAKYMHDAKMRKTLHRIGFSDEFIDGNDVSYIALKVLQELKECMDAHHGDASGC